jgi:RNA polymerase sigma-70 factor (ECF subfamily)
LRRDAERLLDEYLAASARAGDARAFERLAARWQPKLLGHAWRLTGEADLARDVVQDAWVQIARGLRRLDDAAAFPAWAFRIVTRRAAKSIRQRQKARRIADTVGAHPNDAPALEAERNADAATVAAALKSLPPDQRAAMALFYLEDLSVAEIAVALQAPVGTIKTRLMHGRKKIRDALQGDES